MDFPFAIGRLEIRLMPRLRPNFRPALLLLHGFLCDSGCWRRQFSGLSDRFTVIAWDAPGAGLSSDPPNPFTTASYSQSLAGFLDAIGIERAHILGLSWGGILAHEFYRCMPSDSAMSLSSAEVDTTDLLPNIDVATLVLEGDDDRRSPLHIARQLHASIPNAQLAIISNAGHVSNMEQPDVFNSEVRRFCISADVA
jgi:pimeloyl-ACP methyl ester carboxylesterase